MALDPQRQRLEALQEEERVEGAEGGAQVAQPLHAQLEDEGQAARPPPRSSRRGRRGRARRSRGSARRRPSRSAPVDHHAADRRAVAADPLRGRVDDDVRAVLDRPGEERRERVVDDERDAVRVGDVGDRRDVGHVEARVADGLEVDRPGVRVDGGREVGRVRAVHEARA